MQEPITITLYDKHDEPIKTYSTRPRMFILKRAAVLAAEMQDVDLSAFTPKMPPAKRTFLQKLFRKPVKQIIQDTPFDKINEFIVEAFNGQFTADELDKGAEIGEVFSAFYAIASRASGQLREIAPKNPLAAKLKK